MANPKALITGASSGLGAEFARQLAAKGFDLLMVARREDRMKVLAAEIKEKYPVDIETMRIDLTNEDDLRKLEERIRESHPIDLLVNNAGFATVGKFVDVGSEKHSAMIRVHVEAPVRLCRAVLPSMVGRNGGDIINVASVAAFIAGPRNSIYCAAKMFLVVFSESLSEEYRRRGIRVQALCPGFTYTGFHDTPEYEGIDARADIPRVFWMKADKVVRVSLASLERRKVICVPGTVYKIAVFLLRNPVSAYFIRIMRRAVDTGTHPLR